MGISKTDTPIPFSTGNSSMELGETLTITATLNPSTFIALRSKTNSEVTIRVSTPPCSPIISPSKRSPRVPSCKLSPLITTKSSTKIVDIDSIQLEKINLKGWVMLSTPQTLLWSIAWVCATSSPSPRICVMMECEALTQNSTPYHYEDITGIVELGSLSNGDSVDVEEPVRFEITTNNNQYKIVTNSFMTPRMRSLMACLNPTQSAAEEKSSATFLPTEQLNTTPLPDSPPRACTPIPVSIVIKSTKQDKSVKDNKINKISKLLRKSSSKSIKTTQEKPATKPHPPPLVRTNTPFPERASVQPCIISKRLKTRSISLEAVPVAPIVKPAPRPISFNVFEHIQKNSDIPVRKDTPQRVRVADKGSCLEFPIPRRQVNTIVSILTNCEPSLRTSTTIAGGDSDFSDNDDGASDFSEESDWDNSKVFQASLEQMQGEINALDDVDGEVLDLCERSKGLSPVLNYGPFCPKDDDDDENSSCFSEDMSDSNSSQGDEAASTTLEEMDEFSTENNSEDSATSSVIGSPFFDPAVLTSESDLGSWQKTAKAEKDNIRKSLKLEKEERKRKEKEAKQLARMSKKLQKKQIEEEKANNRKSIKEETPIRKSLKLSEGIAGSRLSLRLKGCVRKIFGRIGVSDDTSK